MDDKHPGDSFRGMPFDFYKDFLGVDIAKVEQVGELIGIATAASIKGMVKGGLTEHEANIIIGNVTNAITKAILTSGRE